MRSFNHLGTAMGMLAAFAAAGVVNVQAQDGKGIIGYASPIASNPDQQSLALGIQKAAEQRGYEFRMLDSNLSVDKQVGDVDTFIGLGVKGLVSFSLNPNALAGAYIRAEEQGIPVATFNSSPEEAATVSAVIKQERFYCPQDGGTSTDMVDFIKSETAQPKVLIIGPPPVPSLEVFTACFVQFAEKAGFQVLERQDNTNDTAVAASPIVSGLLLKHPDANVIWTYNDTTAQGAGAAVVQAGKTVASGDKEGIIVVGGGTDQQAIDAITAGVMTVSYANNSFEAGAAAANAVIDSIEGVAFEKEQTVPTARWDATNAARYVPDAKKSVPVVN